ncbi:MAG: hypothetical protein EOO20_19140 [Chryseobacterium sp.]|nr:MAG: hypothetical protein EOO20_19140 [Chryseobacterium sp.]
MTINPLIICYVKNCRFEFASKFA